MRRNILITGASSGLGAEMARQFAAKGRNLALTARREERLDELRTELTERYPTYAATKAGTASLGEGLRMELLGKPIEAEKAKAYVPPWPWSPVARVMRYAPKPLLKRMM
ncbi:SDR family NAD(P)-dependent oxidoreductase [Kribbella sp. NPDC051952]|uniref:SDR family NAD(P)-dependent oxidoreductase n=1 Tax=Kribbella sp. NPDC051952 TaxID=3154851 RepID=UPI00341540AB